jgi:DNA modification methylase
MEQNLKFEKRKLEDLSAADYNPRKQLTPDDAEYQKIKRSIEEFGYVDPIIVNDDGTIIGGHQRCTVLKDLGYDDVDVVVVSLDKQREKALNIALNKITGEWDELKLKDLLLDLDLGDYDISLTGFEQQDLTELVDKLAVDENETSDDGFGADEALEQVSEPVTRRGDIWKLGRHRLMCGDSTEESDVDELMNGELADLVITDPPYNVDYGDKAAFVESHKTGRDLGNTKNVANDNMNSVSFYEFILSAYRSAYEHMRAGAAIYVFHADAIGHIFRQAFLDAGLHISQCLIWEKNTLLLSRNDYQWRHEPILYGWKEGSAHYFINDRTQDTIMLEDDIDYNAMKKNELVAYLEDLRRRYQNMTSVIYENKPTRNDMHPTMKPVTLIGKFITNSSKSGWNVLDLFGGSGSTLIASEQLGRTAFLMELDERYCDVIVKRWEEYTGQKAERIPATQGIL